MPVCCWCSRILASSVFRRSVPSFVLPYCRSAIFRIFESCSVSLEQLQEQQQQRQRQRPCLSCLPASSCLHKRRRRQHQCALQSMQQPICAGCFTTLTAVVALPGQCDGRPGTNSSLVTSFSTAVLPKVVYVREQGADEPCETMSWLSIGCRAKHLRHLNHEMRYSALYN
jgi:hypothetical protein